MIVYDKLWRYLYFSKHTTKIFLLNCVSPPTLAKLSKNQIVSVDTIDKICAFLNCQPSDIMEYISNDLKVNES